MCSRIYQYIWYIHIEVSYIYKSIGISKYSYKSKRQIKMDCKINFDKMKMSITWIETNMVEASRTIISFVHLH